MEDFVKISASTPSKMLSFNIANLALFTNEDLIAGKQWTSGLYNTYKSLTEVMNDFGVNSRIYSLVNIKSQQVKNLFNNDGLLYIIKSGIIEATRGNVLTKVLTSNLANFKSISDGEMVITINETPTETFTLTELNFTACSSLSDIIDVINQRGLPIDLLVTSDSKIKFISKRIGVDSKITISAVSGGTGTDLTGEDYFDITNAVVTDGVNAVVPTLDINIPSSGTINQLIAKMEILNQNFFAGFALAFDLELSAKKDIISNLDNSKYCYCFNCEDSKEYLEIKNIYDTIGKNKVLKFAPFTCGGDQLAGLKLVCGSYAKVASLNHLTQEKTVQNTTHAQTVSNIDINTFKYYISGVKSLANSSGIHCYSNHSGINAMRNSDIPYSLDEIFFALDVIRTTQVYLFNNLRNRVTIKTQEGLNNVKRYLMSNLFNKYKANNYFGEISEEKIDYSLIRDKEACKRALVDTNAGYYIEMPLVSEVTGREAYIKILIVIGEQIYSFNVDVSFLN